MKRVVILFSGTGTNLEKLAQELPKAGIKIAAAVTNRPGAGGIARAQKYGIPVEVIDHTRFDSREAFDKVLVETIGKYRPDLTVMAGFMRILTPVFTKAVNAVNLHPSLLPKFKGARAIERAFESGDEVCGISIHHVTGELDGGEVIAQASFRREPDMDLETFTQKIHELEYDLYPKTVIALLNGPLS